ncbi:hypothetical protein QR680_015128 [Steinernema hermaphroditum]|uniref:Uncharacterized protein n=1 Tax=Steinernema hermaphroditum TaxID=289476 RepID=A0AA39M5F5_9BILA|nr:hypothetical protein QR680_015128 [Steinernema hermaphroditum]
MKAIWAMTYSYPVVLTIVVIVFVENFWNGMLIIPFLWILFIVDLLHIRSRHRRFLHDDQIQEPATPNPAFLVGEPYHGAGTVAAGNLPYPPPPRTNNFMRTDPDRFKKANVKLDQLEAAMGQVEPLGLGIDEDVMLSEEPLKESTW